MSVETRGFGRMSDGREAHLVVLSNEAGMRVGVSQVGACLQSAAGRPASMPARVRQSTKNAKNAGEEPETTPATSSWSSRMGLTTATDDSRSATKAASSSDTPTPAASAMAPRPAATGRLGIRRTMRSVAQRP